MKKVTPDPLTSIPYFLVEDERAVFESSKRGQRMFRIRVWRRAGQAPVTLIQDPTGAPIGDHWLIKVANYVRTALLGYADGYYFLTGPLVIPTAFDSPTPYLPSLDDPMWVAHFDAIGPKCRGYLARPLVQAYRWDALDRLVGLSVEP